MPIEPRLRPLLAVARMTDRHDPSVPMSVRRRRLAARAAGLGGVVMRRGPAPAHVVHHQVPVAGGAVTVRVYVPHGVGPHPLYVFLHGGGWCVGTLDERDPRCRAVSAGARCIVASVDYRLAPENRFPTPLEDCWAALCWLVDNAARLGADPRRVAIGGESAGANLAAVCALRARDRGGPRLCHQWLDVPATDATLAQEGHRNVADGYLLDAVLIDEFLAEYLGPDGSRTDPRVSPLLAASHAALPPAWIMSAEYDRLRGDAAAYADALRAAGVAVRHTRLAGHVHMSFAFTRLLPSAAAYEAAAIAALAAAFAQE
ncbi:MAG: alpha/beta hydrolase [bacterium]|nr:alpha/beta hydrolase [bacterium]